MTSKCKPGAVWAPAAENQPSKKPKFSFLGIGRFSSYELRTKKCGVIIHARLRVLYCFPCDSLDFDLAQSASGYASVGGLILVLDRQISSEIPSLFQRRVMLISRVPRTKGFV